MNVRIISLIVFSAIVTGVFVALGTWQLQRMEWKTELLAAIDERMLAAPVSLPVALDPVTDKYLRVTVTGEIGTDELHVLTSITGTPGFKIITTMDLPDGRRILIDRGFVPEIAKTEPRFGGPTTAIGSLLWPLETDKYTPAADRSTNIWFARDVELMSAELGTLAILVAITESDNNENITPQPIEINIHNRHLEYVLTWYGFAIIWVGMIGLLIWRNTRRTQPVDTQ